METTLAEQPSHCWFFKFFILPEPESQLNPFSKAVPLFQKVTTSTRHLLLCSICTLHFKEFISFWMPSQKCKEQAQLLYYLKYLRLKHWPGEAAAFLVCQPPCLGKHRNVTDHLGIVPLVSSTTGLYGQHHSFVGCCQISLLLSDTIL